MPRYLITSVSAKDGGLYLFDSSDYTYEQIHRGRYRGITLAPDGWYYTVSGIRRHHKKWPTEIWRFHSETWEAENLGQVDYGGCHDLRWYGDSFYLVASKGNWIIRLDSQLREIDRLQIYKSNEDVCHVNCLCERDGAIYTSIFSLSEGAREEKRWTTAWTHGGKLLRLDWERKTFEVAYEPLNQPHSLSWGGDQIYLVESRSSRISRVDLQRKTLEPLLRLNGFVRGLCVGADEVVVGVCPFINPRGPVARLAAWVGSLLRTRSFAGLVVVDPKKWTPIRRIECAGDGIYDILRVS